MSALGARQIGHGSKFEFSISAQSEHRTLWLQHPTLFITKSSGVSMHTEHSSSVNTNTPWLSCVFNSMPIAAMKPGVIRCSSYHWLACAVGMLFPNSPIKSCDLVSLEPARPSGIPIQMVRRPNSSTGCVSPLKSRSTSLPGSFSHKNFPSYSLLNPCGSAIGEFSPIFFT